MATYSRPCRLSSRETLFLKYILAPGLAFIWVACSALALAGKAGPQDASPWLLLLFLSFGLGGAYLFHRCYGGLKNVWLTDNELLISNGFHVEQIPLACVVGLSTRFLGRRGEAIYIIEFDRETFFGFSIEFLCRQCDSSAMRRVMTTVRWNKRKRRRTGAVL